MWTTLRLLFFLLIYRSSRAANVQKLHCDWLHSSASTALRVLSAGWDGAWREWPGLVSFGSWRCSPTRCRQGLGTLHQSVPVTSATAFVQSCLQSAVDEQRDDRTSPVDSRLWPFIDRCHSHASSACPLAWALCGYSSTCSSWRVSWSSSRSIV